jgi:glycosyltransferase involved in cell wall biosynthesis
VTDGRGQDIDCVIVGFNCATTLGRCIEGVKATQYTRGTVRVIYADGGSVDGSVTVAKGYGGVTVVEVAGRPSMGAVRNAAWKAGSAPLIQFIAADTSLSADWFQVATKGLTAEIGAIFGQRREIDPERSRYNKIADLEWNPTEPAGEVAGFGNDVLLRRTVLEATGGYNEELVMGHEADLSQRIRDHGSKIFYLEHLMTKHDVNLTRWDQWWRHAYRRGYGLAAFRHLHPVTDLWREWWKRVWLDGGLGGGLFLLGLIFAAWNMWWLALWIPATYLILQPRIRQVETWSKRLGVSLPDAALYTWHRSLVVVPQMLGVLRWYWAKWTGRKMKGGF